MSDRILKDTAYEIAKNRKYDVYQKALASMVYKFFDKKTGVAVSVNEHLAEELFKPVVKTFRRRVYTIFKENIWRADFAEIWSLSNKNKNFKYLLYVKPLKDKKGKQFLMLLLK